MGLLAASLLCLLSAASLSWTKPLRDELEVVRTRRAAESPFDTARQSGVHLTVKKAGPQLHQHGITRRSSDIEKELHQIGKSGSHKKESKSKHLSPEEELRQLTSVNKAAQKQTNHHRDHKQHEQRKTHAKQTYQHEQHNQYTPYNYPELERDLAQLRMMWAQDHQQEERRRKQRPDSLKNSEKRRDEKNEVKKISSKQKVVGEKKKLSNSVQGAGSEMVFTREQKRNILKKLKHDSIAEEDYSDRAQYLPKSSSHETKPKTSVIKPQTVKSHHLKEVLKKHNSKISHSTSRTNRKHKRSHRKLSNAVRMRRSLVHLASENSMSQRSMRRRRRRRDVYEDEQNDEEIDPVQLQLMRALLEDGNDAYYAENGPDSDSAPLDIAKRDGDISTSEDVEEDSSDALPDDFATALEEAVEEDRPISQVDTPTQQQKPPLIMFLVNHESERGLFIPLNQEKARAGAIKVAALEAAEQEEERERLFALATLLSQNSDSEVEHVETASEKRSVPIGYPGVGYSLVEKRSPQEFADEDVNYSPDFDDEQTALAKYITGYDDYYEKRKRK